jgi:hypothetical protein
MIKTLSVALAAVFVFGAVAAASASALPEFKSPEGFPVPFTATSGKGTLQTLGGRTVTCEKDKAKGEILSATKVDITELVFEGCTSVVLGATFNCGTITAKPLEASPKYLTTPNTKEEVGIYFKPVNTAEEFTTFNCTNSLFGTETLTVTGAVVGKVTPINTLTKTATLKFEQSSGMQKYTGYFEGSTFTKKVLQTAGSGPQNFKEDESGIEGTDTITTTKSIEIAG